MNATNISNPRPTPTQHKTVCAWCNPGKPCKAGTSHGICEACRKLMLADYRRGL